MPETGGALRRYVCILCPTSCRVAVSGTARGDATARGAACGRGRDWVLAEVTQPLRTFTGTVRVVGGARPVVAVKTDRPIPKGLVMDVARTVARVEVPAPVKAGDVLGDALLGGARLVATADAP